MSSVVTVTLLRAFAELVLRGDMSDLEYWSHNRRFGLRIPQSEMRKVQAMCRDSQGLETGGVLVGYYTERFDCAVVTEASGPPADSDRGRSTFLRGTRGIQSWLRRLWQGLHHHYLGEWHYHPGGLAVPSPTDNSQMHSIATSSSYRRPEPILLIVGETETRAYVFDKNDDHLELISIDGLPVL